MNGRLALQTLSMALPFANLILKPGVFILGRSSACEFVVKDVTVSRRHAEISVTGRCVNVRDLDSRNGTFVDDKRVQNTYLEEGQRVQFGKISFLLADIDGDIDEAPSESDTKSGRNPDKTSDLEQIAPLIAGRFSQAQRRVFNLLFGGLAEKKIARRLHLSQCTVHNHVQAIYRIVGVHSRVELFARMLRLKG
jgi:DNA-binding CsgD family transcriptional regulator